MEQQDLWEYYAKKAHEHGLKQTYPSSCSLSYTWKLCCCLTSKKIDIHWRSSPANNSFHSYRHNLVNISVLCKKDTEQSILVCNIVGTPTRIKSFCFFICINSLLQFRHPEESLFLVWFQNRDKGSGRLCFLFYSYVTKYL